MHTARRGFTLIEMLIALVLLAIVAEVLVRLLTASQRVSRAQSQQVVLQSNVRAGALLVPNELRELSVGGSDPDLLVLGRDSITYRAMRSAGVACAATPVRITLRAALGSGYRDPAPGRDSLLVYVEGDPRTSADDHWSVFPVAGAPSAGSCPDGAPATVLATLIPSDTIARLALETPVRTFEVMQFRLYQSGGQYWLGSRGVSAGEAQMQPILGPLKTNGFELAYFDSTGVPTAAIPAVRTIEVTIRGVTDGTVSNGTDRLHIAEDSLVSRVRLRNAPGL
jgi:prepilin-type N-terminal cleavage/methylation domain-containing protein